MPCRYDPTPEEEARWKKEAADKKEKERLKRKAERTELDKVTRLLCEAVDRLNKQANNLCNECMGDSDFWPSVEMEHWKAEHDIKDAARAARKAKRKK